MEWLIQYSGVWENNQPVITAPQTKSDKYLVARAAENAADAITLWLLQQGDTSVWQSN